MQYHHRRKLAGLIAAVTTAGAALALPASAAAPPRPGQPGADRSGTPPLTSAPLAVPSPQPADRGELVVGLRPGASISAPLRRLAAAEQVTPEQVEPVAGQPAAAVEVAAGDADAAVAALRRDPDVRYVERNGRAQIAAVTANDYFRPQQWALDRAAVPAAWQHSTGDPAVTVAVLDTGVTATDDLPSGRIVAGYDFINNDANPADDHGHGTMVGTTIAGAGDDAVGGGYSGGSAGVCWTCQIMPVKVLDGDGTGELADIAAGIGWAVANGADIINLSLVSPTTNSVLSQAVAAAVAADVLVVAAAGNSGIAMRFYPAASPGVVAVGASTSADHRYFWSNYGASWVDVAAPGCVIAGDRFAWWREFCGTSAAAPMVAGIAALALAADPAATAAQLSAALTSTADPLPAAWTAHGRVNALAVVDQFAPAGGPVVTLPSHAAHALLRGTVNLAYEAADPDGVAAMALLVNGAQLDASTGTGPHPAPLDTAGLPRDTSLTVVAEDALGNVSAIAVPVIADNLGPTVRIAAPTYLRHVRGRVTVAAAATDPSGVARVALTVDGQVVSDDTVAPFTPSWNPRFRSGRVRLNATSWDRAGNSARATQIIELDNAGPSITRIGGPAGDAHIRGTVYVPARSTDRSRVARVELWAAGRRIASDTRSPFVLPLVAAQQPRVMRVQLRSVDRLGTARWSRAWRWTR